MRAAIASPRIALLTSTRSGRLFVLSSTGQITSTMPMAGWELAASANGWLTVIENTQLKFVHEQSGLAWVYNGDSSLRFARHNPSTGAVAVCSENGTLAVIDPKGHVQEIDLHCVAVPTWLPDGELLLTTWLGRVMRVDPRSDFAVRWSVALPAGDVDLSKELFNLDLTPRSRMEGWSNGTAPPATGELNDNLTGLAMYFGEGTAPYRYQPGQWVRDPGTVSVPLLFAPQYMNPYNPMPAPVTIQLSRIESTTVTGIAFQENPYHSETWLRNLEIEIEGLPETRRRLLYDGTDPVHFHALDWPPFSASREDPRYMRIYLPEHFYSNLNLERVRLYGTVP